MSKQAKCLCTCLLPLLLLSCQPKTRIQHIHTLLHTYITHIYKRLRHFVLQAVMHISLQTYIHIKCKFTLIQWRNACCHTKLKMKNASTTTITLKLQHCYRKQYIFYDYDLIQSKVFSSFLKQCQCRPRKVRCLCVCVHATEGFFLKMQDFICYFFCMPFSSVFFFNAHSFDE